MDHSLSNSSLLKNLQDIDRKYREDRPDRPAIIPSFSSPSTTYLCQGFAHNVLLAQLLESLQSYAAQEALSFEYHKNASARECILEILAALNTPQDLQNEILTIFQLLTLHCHFFQRKITYELTVWQKKFQKVARSPFIDRKDLLNKLSDKYYSWIATQKGMLQKPWLRITATFSDDCDGEDGPISSPPSPRVPSERHSLLGEHQAKIAVFAPIHLAIEEKIGIHSKILAQARTDLDLLQDFSVKIQKILDNTRWTQESLSQTVLALAAAHHELQLLPLSPASFLESDRDALCDHILTKQMQIQNQFKEIVDSPDRLKVALGAYLEKLLSLYPIRLANLLVTPLWIARCAHLGGLMIAQGLEEKFLQELQNLPSDQEEATQLQADLLFACNLLVTYCPPEDFSYLATHQLYARIASQCEIQDSAPTLFKSSDTRPSSAYKDRFRSRSESEYHKQTLQKDPKDSAFSACSSRNRLVAQQLDISLDLKGPDRATEAKDQSSNRPSQRSTLLFSQKSDPFAPPKSDRLFQSVGFLPAIAPSSEKANQKSTYSLQTSSRAFHPSAGIFISSDPLSTSQAQDLLKAPTQSLRKQLARPFSQK